MNSERDDLLLDACLDEVLGGRTPPDLTARIMQAFAAGSNGSGVALDGEPEPPPVLAHVNRATRSGGPANGDLVVEVNRAAPTVRIHKWRTTHHLVALTVAASVIGLIIGATLFVPQRQPEIANRSQKSDPNKALASADQSLPDVATPPERETPERVPKVSVARSDAPADVPQPLPPAESSATRVAVDNTPQATSTAPAVTEKSRRNPSPDAEIISFVNSEIARSWTEAGVKPAPPEKDETWCRRLFVRVLGRIPEVEELNRFLNDRLPGRRQKLVERLLNDERYVAEYARHWSIVWANVFIGRTGGGSGSLASRGGLEQYLRGALAHNKPYDQMVRELLTATGSTNSADADFNPAVNFLLDGLDKDLALATSRVSRVFLGQQLQCAQCHNHPTQDWSQDHFWALNSFFRQMKAERQGEAAKLVNADFPGQGRGSRGGEVFYETPTGLLKTAFPRFIDGTKIPASGELAQVDRRNELARLVAQSDHLPKALVNRVWSHFFGYGFTRPVDDLGPNTSPSHPQVLGRLAQEFAAHHYDLKSVIRWTVLSEPFARSSRADMASKDAPEEGQVALFSRYYSRQMAAEEVYNSLVQAAQIRKTAANETEIAKARVDWLSQFQRNMGTDDAQEETHFSGGVRQSLIMMNGDLTRLAVNSQQGGLLKTVAASDMPFDRKVEHLFLSALSRQPTRREQQVAVTILNGSKGDGSAALEDILWALLNSNEFILDH